MKTITKDDPKFDDMFAAVITIFRGNGAKIDNIEALKRDVEAIIYMEGRVTLELRDDAEVDVSRIIGA